MSSNYEQLKRIESGDIVEGTTPETAPDSVSPVLTHNGMLTIENTKTGQHRTFRIKTQKPDASFAPGERIVSLLIGPDNEDDYFQFGFVKLDRIIVWKKSRGTIYDTYAKMLMRPVHYKNKGCTYRFDTRCRMCNRTLTVPTSIDSGIGPKCAERAM